MVFTIAEFPAISGRKSRRPQIACSHHQSVNFVVYFVQMILSGNKVVLVQKSLEVKSEVTFLKLRWSSDFAT